MRKRSPPRSTCHGTFLQSALSRMLPTFHVSRASLQVHTHVHIHTYTLSSGSSRVMRRSYVASLKRGFGLQHRFRLRALTDTRRAGQLRSTLVSQTHTHMHTRAQICPHTCSSPLFTAENLCSRATNLS